MKKENLQLITKKYKDHKKLYANNNDNLEGTDKFFEKSFQNWTRKNKNMNRPITINETETVIKKSSNKQKFRTRWLHKLYQIFREELMLSFSSSSKKQVQSHVTK